MAGICTNNSERTTMISDSRDSRLSNRISKSMLERDKSYLKNPLDYIGEEVEYPIFIKVNLLIGDIKKNINLKITDSDTIKDILKRSINLFNDILKKEKIHLQLNKDYNKFYLKPSKKSGKPDNDLPSNILSYIRNEYEFQST